MWRVYDDVTIKSKGKCWEIKVHLPVFEQDHETVLDLSQNLFIG